MEDDEFLKILELAYKKGLVKDASEAFIEYPVEDEWHKGNAYLAVMEDSEDYSLYSIGDIVYVKNYSYSNGKTGQNHFFVIISQNNLAVPIENFGMLISSNTEKLKFDSNILLEKYEKNNLNKDSIVKTDVIYKLRSSNILFKLGYVEQDKIKLYLDNFNKNNL